MGWGEAWVGLVSREASHSWLESAVFEQSPSESEESQRYNNLTELQSMMCPGKTIKNKCHQIIQVKAEVKYYHTCHITNNKTKASFRQPLITSRLWLAI